MWEESFYHRGMRELQDRYDGRRTADALVEHRRHYEFWADERELIETSPFFMVASAAEGHVDCSIKSGEPGFVKVVGPGTIEYPEYDGNSMYRTAGNVLLNPVVGLLFVRFDGRSRRIRINGRATLHDDEASLSRHYGAKFITRVQCEIYPNCPRYLPDFEHARSSAHPPKPGYVPPPPEWKGWDFVRDTLPFDDPHRK